MVGQRQTILKLNCLKCPNIVPKNKICTRKYVIQKFMFGVYLLFSDFLLKSPKDKENQQQRSLILQYYFNQKTSHFTNLKSLIIFLYTPVTKLKTLLTLQIFQQTCFQSVTEKTFTLQHLHTSKNCILEALGKQMPVCFCKSS